MEGINNSYFKPLVFIYRMGSLLFSYVEGGLLNIFKYKAFVLPFFDGLCMSKYCVLF